MSLKYTTLLFALSSTAFAGTMGESSPYSWVGTFSIGPVWEAANSQQTLDLAPGVTKTYTANNSTSTLADGEVFLGIQAPLNQQFFAHFGIAGALTSPAKLTGSIWDDADPDFNNYNYGYKIQHSHVALKAKIFKETS